jgi:hypothetical protein
VNKSIELRWAGYVARVEERRRILGFGTKRRPFGRLRCRWEDNIKMDIREVGWGSMDWVGLVQSRGRWRALVNAVMNLRVP